MAYTPLAQVSDLTDTPLAGIVRAFSDTQKQNLLTRASRAFESRCDRRLSAFTIDETHRADEIEPDESDDVGAVMPLDEQGTLGMSYARALGGGQQIRYLSLRQFPPLWEEMWVGTVNSVTIYRTPAGSQVIQGGPSAPWVFTPDDGRLRFNLGIFCPPGSTIVTNYSGGYVPVVPEDIVQGVIWEATRIALLDIAPGQRQNLDITEITKAVASFAKPYVRT